jgi:hypothetical protein
MIETISDEQIETRDADTIELERTISDRNSSATVTNVHYCLEMDSNLLSLGIFEAKGFEFRGKNGHLQVIDDENDDVVLEAKRQNNVYLLNQPQNEGGHEKQLGAKAFEVKKASLDV